MRSTAPDGRGEGASDPHRAGDRFGGRCADADFADSVAKLWKNGTPFDTLAKKYHDYAGKEETSLLTPLVRDSLPVTYQKAFLLKKPGDIVDFQIPGSAQHPEVPKFVVAQLLTVDEGGERRWPR